MKKTLLLIALLISAGIYYFYGHKQQAIFRNSVTECPKYGDEPAFWDHSYYSTFLKYEKVLTDPGTILNKFTRVTLHIDSACNDGSIIKNADSIYLGDYPGECHQLSENEKDITGEYVYEKINRRPAIFIECLENNTGKLINVFSGPGDIAFLISDIQNISTSTRATKTKYRNFEVYREIK